MSRSSRPVFLLVILISLLVPCAAIGCLWDYDTIKMERTRFPGTLELITGKFLRHSPEFYRWRIDNRLKRLESEPNNIALLDDLAVAYSKTNQHEKAIEAALRTEQISPGRYETAANLASFYFHSGKLKEGLPHIERALKINPDAHFGREKYQKLLVEFVLQESKGGPVKLPLARIEIYPSAVAESPNALQVTMKYTFVSFLKHEEFSNFYLPPQETSDAIKGILGMMKFGKHDSPMLLEALGSLLLLDGTHPEEDAKLLASRAFLKASLEVPEGPARIAYRGMAARALFLQASLRDGTNNFSLERVEEAFKAELAEADAWYGELRERELGWIRDGLDPETEFDKLYEMEPEVSGMEIEDPLTPLQRWELFGRIIRWGLLTFGVIQLLILLAFFTYRIRKRQLRSRFAGMQSQESAASPT